MKTDREIRREQKAEFKATAERYFEDVTKIKQDIVLVDSYVGSISKMTVEEATAADEQQRLARLDALKELGWNVNLSNLIVMGNATNFRERTAQIDFFKVEL
jgi:hypothetical protein